MKIIVVGVGSIGIRHMKNLVELGHEVYAVDINMEKLDKVRDIASGTFGTVKEALKIRPDVAFICTFSNDHVGNAIECVNAGCHIFIEKPLSLDLNGVDELIKIIKDKKSISIIGCNMRFHPAILYLRDILDTHPSFKKKWEVV